MQSDAFWGLQQQENQGQFKAACLQFFFMEKYTIHKNPSWK